MTNLLLIYYQHAGIYYRLAWCHRDGPSGKRTDS